MILDNLRAAALMEGRAFRNVAVGRNRGYAREVALLDMHGGFSRGGWELTNSSPNERSGLSLCKQPEKFGHAPLRGGIFMYLYIIGGIVLGALAGLVLLPKGACRDGSCPLTSGKFGGIFLGAMVGLGLGMLAFTQFGAQKPSKELKSVVDVSTHEESSLLAHVDTAGFDKAISKGTVLVDFFATWCGPCKMQTPILEKFADKHQQTLKIIKVNIDNSPEIAGKFGVTGVPALVFFHEGKLIGGMMGLQQDAQLEEAYGKVKEMIATPPQGSPAKEAASAISPVQKAGA